MGGCGRGGSFVLSVKWKGAVHHFQLAKNQLGKYNISKLMFDSVADLIGALKHYDPLLPLVLTAEGVM